MLQNLEYIVLIKAYITTIALPLEISTDHEIKIKSVRIHILWDRFVLGEFIVVPV